MSNSIYIVYETTNLINGKYYIGVHLKGSSNKDYLGSGKILRKSIIKNGKESFIRETLREFYNKQDAYDYEKLVITEYMMKSDNCYNISYGGWGGGVGFGSNHPNYGKKQSPETCLKKSINSTKHWKGKKFTTEHCINISESKKGKKIHSDETKQRMSDDRKGNKHAMYGKKHTKESRLKMSKSLSGKNHYRSYTWYIDNHIFHSGKDASEHFKVSESTIQRWCGNGKYSKSSCYKEVK